LPATASICAGSGASVPVAASRALTSIGSVMPASSLGL
jgi:hypothetical protein